MTISTTSIKTTFLTISLKMENDYFQFSFSLKSLHLSQSHPLVRLLLPFSLFISTFNGSNQTLCTKQDLFRLRYPLDLILFSLLQILFSIPTSNMSVL
jgi:hypothetical protein